MNQTATPSRTQPAGTPRTQATAKSRSVFTLTASGFVAAARAKAADKRAKADAAALSYGLVYNGGNPNCPTGFHLQTPSGVIVRVSNGRTLRVDDGQPYKDQTLLDGINDRLAALRETFRVYNKHQRIVRTLWLELPEVSK